MSRALLTLLGLVVLAYLVLCSLLYFFQRSMIYFPQPRSAGGGASTISLPSEAGPVLVTVRPQAGPDAVLYFGGNAEDVAASLPDLAAAFPRHAIYLLHYRGYGGSAGTPSEAALFTDAPALFDKVRASHTNIVAVGRSLGSGVAVHLASLRPVSRLVLVTPYDSLQELAVGQFPWFPVRWLLRDRFESWRYAQKVVAPTLVIAAEHDEVIPRASSEALYRRFAAGIALFKLVAGAGHNSISASPEYIPLLKGTP